VAEHITLEARLGPFRLLESLGSGAMGDVYLAEPDQGQGPRVALKVYHASVAARPGFLDRFRREAAAGSRIDDPHVVRTHAADVYPAGSEARCCLVMEYVDGKTLRDLLRESGPLPESLVREVGRQAAQGLAAIHAAGVVHRDVKPENLIITRENVVKIMDLGVAGIREEAKRITGSGCFVGSVLYAAPEQFGDSAPDGRADLYSLGLLLYELVTGRNPFDGLDVPTVIRHQLSTLPCRAGDLNPQVSPFLEEVLQTLLAKDPDERFASASELQSVLRDGEASEWWRDRERTMRSRPRHRIRRLRVPRETSLHGRDAELEELVAAFERAKSGEGGAVIVSGDTGMGKSRLADEFAARLEASGEEVHFLHGGYPPGGAATAFGAFAGAYREHFGDADIDESLRRYLPDSPGVVPGLAALLHGVRPPTGTIDLPRDAMQAVVVQVTRGLAAERPTVVLIEDLHFAPNDGRGLFASVALAAPGHRILLIGTTRPSAEEKWLSSVSRLPGCVRVELAPLTAADVERLLREALRSDRLAEELGAAVALRSGGNPYFVFEILRGLRETGALRQRDDGSWEASRRISHVDVPISLQDLVRARIEDLGMADRDLLEVASCCGHEFDPRLAAEAASLDVIAALRAFGRIERRYRLVRSVGDRFVFDHHQVQEILHEHISPPLRSAYHTAIAETMEQRTRAAATEPESLDAAVCVDIARHFLAGGSLARARRYLGSALDRLERSYRNDAALALIDAALAAPDAPDGRERAELLLRRARRLDLLGRWSDEREAIDEAVRIADAIGDVRLAGQAWEALGWNLFRTSRSEECRAAAERALALARMADDPHTEAQAAGSLGIVMFELGRYADAARWYSLELSIARRLGDDSLAAKALLNLGNVGVATGTPEAARTSYEKCIAVARSAGDRRSEAGALGNLAAVLVDLGLFDEARTAALRGLAVAREIGARRTEATVCSNLGALSTALGRLDEARRHFRRRRDLARDAADVPGEALAVANLGRIARTLGDRDRAREHFARCLDLVRSIAFRRMEVTALAGLAALAEDAGDDDSAERTWREAATIGRGSGHRDGLAEALCSYGALLARRGRHDEARSLLHEACDVARRHGPVDALLLATAHTAALPDADVAAVRDEVTRIETRAGVPARMEGRLVLWRVSGDPVHLAEAKRLLDHLVEHAPAESRRRMRCEVRVHREISDAWARIV
jgi:tetratricopeptide (TPR) repeat protein